MNAELEQLERAVEREMALLRGLPDEPLAPASLRRLRTTVLSAARPAARRARWIAAARLAVGVAAAALFAVTLRPLGPAYVPAWGRDADADVRAWARAWDSSATRFGGLFESGAGGTLGEEALSVDELLRGMDESLEAFGAL